jgi:hypothetical protein
MPALSPTNATFFSRQSSSIERRPVRPCPLLQRRQATSKPFIPRRTPTLQNCLVQRISQYSGSTPSDVGSDQLRWRGVDRPGDPVERVGALDPSARFLRLGARGGFPMKELAPTRHGGTHAEAPDGAENCKEQQIFQIIARYRILSPQSGNGTARFS